MLYEAMAFFGVLGSVFCGLSVPYFWFYGTGETKRLQMTKFSFVAFLVFIVMFIFGYTNYVDYEKVLDNQCINLGYTEGLIYADNYYCLRFGDEPEILNVDIEADK
jgi:hypothetical protein